ncbi:MAG: ATP-binding protein [Oscillospiraceae bacterium]|nr:ATP-binding protein [Oscillospiraceae bacterium]
MGSIIIPERFVNKLGGAAGNISKLCENVERFINSVSATSMPFFREYTAHDESHINAVLAMADALIPKTTLKNLELKSMEVLISAVVLHDMGMFIQPDGAHELIFGKYSKQKIERLDTLTWREAWDNYIYQYKRFNNNQLYNIFGDMPPVISLAEDRIDDGENAWRVYGEFFRQYHPRLAHDICNIGFPGDKTIDLFEHCFVDKGDKYIKDIIGLVARSHGMDMRDAQPYLDKAPLATSSPVSMVYGIPVFYLMAILRVADYLHAGSARAPEERAMAQRINSPISRNEYGWNQAVYDTMTWHIKRANIEKPAGVSDTKRSETLEIIADPEDSATFLKLKSWIGAVQTELDKCWAILAEKYENDYPLTIHRITTNIFKDSEIERFNNSFLTKPAALTANPDIVMLLVEPLYNYDPNYGIRELLQNAIDACNERIEWTQNENKRRDAAGMKPLKCPDGLIEIDINTEAESNTFTITDNGIGMNENTLLNYYLVAGASYRNSNAWREAYTDDGGNAKVLRSGRFGIGALATFLIGDEATVTTRHAGDEMGFRFIYGINSLKPINVEKIAGAEIGTTITMLLNQKSKQIFSSKKYIPKWYFFNKPIVRYRMNGEDINRDLLGYIDNFLIPDVNSIEETKSSWHRIVLNNGTIAYWSVAGTSLENINMLNIPKLDWNEKFQLGGYPFDTVVWCNGILVTPSAEQGSSWFNKALIGPGTMHVSFIDSNCLLPVSLNRTHISYFDEFYDIVTDISQYYLAKMMYSEIKKIWVDLEDIEFNSYNDENRRINSFKSYCFYEKGFIPINNAFLSLCHIDTIKCFNMNFITDDVKFIKDIISTENMFSIVLNAVSVSDDDGFYVLPNFYFPKIILLSTLKYVIDHKYNVSIEGSDIKKQYAIYYLQGNILGCNTHMYNVIVDLLGERNTKDFSDDYWIPYDLEDRKRKFPKAFEILKKYITD